MIARCRAYLAIAAHLWTLSAEEASAALQRAVHRKRFRQRYGGKGANL